MEDRNFDRKKVIEIMQNLKAKRIAVAKQNLIAQGETKIDEAKLSELISVKYLGKIELVNEKGELIEKAWFLVQEPFGNFEYKYYVEGENYQEAEFLAAQKTENDNDIMLSTELSDKSEKEQQKIKEQIENKDIEQAKTEKELEEEEAKQLPGLNDEPQLSQKEVNKLAGPKIDLNQKVDGITLAESIGLTGQYIQFVDIDKVRQLIPDFEISSTEQEFIPIEILTNGTANVVGEDKLEFSSIEGGSSAIEHVTMNNEGNRQREQNIETFNIVNRGRVHTISIGFDEDINSPYYEAKYGVRDKEQSSEVAYSQLETVHEGPLKSTSEAEEERHEYTEGETKGIKEVVTEEDAERYAKAKGLYKYDSEGNASLDLETAAEELENESIGGKNIEEIIQEADDSAMQIGPKNNPYFDE